MLRSGKITSEALTRDCLARISERESTVQAWEYLDEEAALACAKACDGELARGHSRGPLHGIPLGVKDVFQTYDMPTKFGSEIYANHRPIADAATVALARRAGMVLLGKTVTTELATYSPGKTRNPHNPSHTPGGSSSGSAAAVADFMVPVALGAQSVGSIVRPAAYCGVVGYKPTFNLLSGGGCKLMAGSLDTVGLLARTVSDVALYAGVQANDSRLLNLPEADGSIRVGFCGTFDFALAQAETIETMQIARERLAKAGARVSEVTLPDAYRPLRDAHWTIFRFELSRAYADELNRHREKLSPVLRDLLESASEISAEEYAAAQATAFQCRAMMNDVMRDVDVLIAPSAPGEAPSGIDSTGSPVFNQIWTLLWVPLVTIPVGEGPNKLPVGLQVSGRIGADHTMLAAAHWIHRTLAREQGRPS
ncbi:MAG TPA: amidase [Burkholderiales bacterium]